MYKYCDLILTKFHKYNDKHHYAIFLTKNDTLIVLDMNTIDYHAEINAFMKINKWKNRPKILDLLVIRYSKSGKLGESRPCFHCIMKLKQSNIGLRNVYYSTNNGIIIKEKFNNMLYLKKHISKRNRK